MNKRFLFLFIILFFQDPIFSTTSLSFYENEIDRLAQYSEDEEYEGEDEEGGEEEQENEEEEPS